MKMSGNMESKYTFTRADAILITLNVIFYILVIWPQAVFCIYLGIFTDKIFTDIYLLIFFRLTLIGCSCLEIYFSCEQLYYRWKFFKYNKNNSFSVDVEKKTFRFQHGDKDVLFKSNDVEEWSWSVYGMLGQTEVVDIVDIKLKDKTRVIIPCGLGNVLNFLQENEEKLLLPKGEQKSKSLRSYIKEIENSSPSLCN
ncbi:MAG: hypothetical protein IKG86_06350 [Paludibacteraceae bacterium]|nr:hypothetical protein [Paludibacteraceae bacterium]